MVVGVITRERVREALDKGITADQIITYLRNHSHPEMRKELPMTVVDQLRLWEMERNRMSVEQGSARLAHLTRALAHLYQQFSSSREFQETCRFARSVDCVLFENTERQILVVSSTGHELVRDWLKKGRQAVKPAKHQPEQEEIVID